MYVMTPDYTLIDINSGGEATVAVLVEEASSESGLTIYLGEVHQRRWIISLSIDILERLAGMEGELYIGMEHFNIEQQDLLDAYLEGEMEWDELVEKYEEGPEGFDLEYYRPLIEWARDNNTHIYGLMPPRIYASQLVRLYMSGDKEGVDRLLARYGISIDDLDAGEEYRERFLQLIPREGPMARLDPEALLLAQSFKDEVMARRIVELSRRYRAGYILTGSGHVEHKGSVPTRVVKHGYRGGYTVVTSREAGREEALEELRRAGKYLVARYLALPR